MSESGRETLSYVREWWEILPDVREWSGDAPGHPGVVGRPSRMSGSGQKAIMNVQEWSRDPPGSP